MLRACSFEDITYNRGQAHWAVVGNAFWVPLLEYWTDHCHLPVTRPDTCRKGVVKLVYQRLREESGQPLNKLRVQLVRAWALWGVESGELFIYEARNKYGNAHHRRWNWQCWDRSSVVSAEGDIVEFVEELILCYGLFNDNTRTSLQGDNLVAELTISSNMGNWHFRIGCCQGRDACFVFPPGRPHEAWEWLTLGLVHTEGNSASIVDRRGASFAGLAWASISAAVFDLSPYVSEWLQTDHGGIG